MPRQQSRNSSGWDGIILLLVGILVAVVFVVQTVVDALRSIPWWLWILLAGVLVWQRRSIAAWWRTSSDQQAVGRQRKQLEEILRQDVASMNGPQFERFLAEYFRSRGYSVQAVGGPGDQGVDLLLESGGRRIAVQAKQWRGPVNNGAVQQVYAGVAHYGAQEGWVVTPSSFTLGAVDLARSTGVKLFDGAIVRTWLAEIASERQGL